MKTLLFILIVISSGAAAGLIHGSVNLVFVEPILDQAIGIENQNLFASGEEKNTPDFWIKYDGYRAWQKSGLVFAGGILGISVGALFGIVFAGIMWCTIFFIPFLKYPANPPTVGDPDTVVLRGILYLTFIAISGFGAVGFYKLSQKLKTKKFIAIAGYAAFIGMMFVVMPENPDKITAPVDLLEHFRITSAFTVSLYWIMLGLILGSLWSHYKPHKEITPSFN
jgi:hypothetical protein